jgi:hypothetical protein
MRLVHGLFCLTIGREYSTNAVAPNENLARRKIRDKSQLVL